MAVQKMKGPMALAEKNLQDAYEPARSLLSKYKSNIDRNKFIITSSSLIVFLSGVIISSNILEDYNSKIGLVVLIITGIREILIRNKKILIQIESVNALERLTTSVNFSFNHSLERVMLLYEAKNKTAEAEHLKIISAHAKKLNSEYAKIMGPIYVCDLLTESAVIGKFSRCRFESIRHKAA